MALVLLAGCLGDAPQADAPGAPVPFRTLLVARDQPALPEAFTGELSPRAWNETWARWAEAAGETRPRPVVDLARERIVAVATGPFGSGCHDVRVANVTLLPEGQGHEGAWLLRYDTYDGEGPGSVCTGSMSWPAHVVAIATQTYGQIAEGRAYGPEDAWPHAPWPGPRTEPLALRTLDHGSFSGIREDRRVALRDAAAWEALWREHRPDAPAPAVDLAREIVVAVVVHGPTGCGAIRLADAAHDADGGLARVEVVLEDPADAQCLAAFEDVFHFAALPAREGDVLFVDRAEAMPS